MVYGYISNLDRQLNETIGLYKNLAKLSQPMLKYIVFTLSILIFTSCFLLLYYLIFSNNEINNTEVQTNKTGLFLNIILPIIIYGLLCPILSNIIGLITKIFFDVFVQKIKINHSYLKHFLNYSHLLNYIIFSKINIIYPIFYIFIYNYDTTIQYIYIFTYICLQINRIFIFYTNNIECKIISIQKCYDDKDDYWSFELEINFNSEKKRIFKRFNDFKYLSNKIYNQIKLPTSSWLFKPNSIKDATYRAKELNKYIKNITSNEQILQNSAIFKFLNDTSSENEKNIILEKEFLSKSESFLENTLGNRITNTFKNIKENFNNIKNDEIINNELNNELNNQLNNQLNNEFKNNIIEDINIEDINIEDIDNYIEDDINKPITKDKIYSNIEYIKDACNKLINEEIEDLFILNEINYYSSIKKRIILLTKDKLYKIKYFITSNTFEIREEILFKNIYFVEYSKITNRYSKG